AGSGNSTAPTTTRSTRRWCSAGKASRNPIPARSSCRSCSGGARPMAWPRRRALPARSSGPICSWNRMPASRRKPSSRTDRPSRCTSSSPTSSRRPASSWSAPATWCSRKGSRRPSARTASPRTGKRVALIPRRDPALKRALGFEPGILCVGQFLADLGVLLVPVGGVFGRALVELGIGELGLDQLQRLGQLLDRDTGALGVLLRLRALDRALLGGSLALLFA